MNYFKIYNDICKRGKLREKNDLEYYEKHHIIPLFFFKSNNRNLRYNDGIFDGDGEFIENYTYLTPREHFLCHLILHKLFYGTRYSLRCGSSVMLFYNNINSLHIRNKYFNPGVTKKYESSRKVILKELSESKKGRFYAKHYLTGEKIGLVENNHPNVLNGMWVHHTKGIKVTSPKRLAKYKELSQGENNSNSVTALLRQNKERIINIIVETYCNNKDDLKSKNTLKENNFNKDKFEKMVSYNVWKEICPQRKFAPTQALPKIFECGNNYHHIVNEKLNLNLKTRYEK